MKKQGKVLRQAIKILRPHLPANALNELAEWFIKNNISLTITPERSSKHGDFKPRNGSPIITVNGTLNRYSFMITLIHEMAHAKMYMDKGHCQPAHGDYWKLCFKTLMKPFLNEHNFPIDVLIPLRRHMQNPSATDARDTELQRALKKYDRKPSEEKKEVIYVEDLPVRAVFSFRGDLYKIEKKLRKNYLCLHLESGRQYRFSPIAEVIPENKVKRQIPLSEIPAGKKFTLGGLQFTVMRQKTDQMTECKETKHGKQLLLLSNFTVETIPE